MARWLLAIFLALTIAGIANFLASFGSNALADRDVVVPPMLPYDPLY